MILIVILLIVLFITLPVFRCFMFNLPKYIFHKLKALYEYIRYKEYNAPEFAGMTLYCGNSQKPMGSGKTLAGANRMQAIYKKFNDKTQIDKITKKKFKNRIMVMSNIELKDIEFIEFKGFEQVTQFVELKNKLEAENPDYRYYLYVFIDEASIFLNSSKWKDKDNPITVSALNDLCQIRHNQIQEICFTSQRFEMCNVNVRRLSSYVKTCNLVDVPFLNKKRFLCINWYISRDLEECTSELMIKPIKRQAIYVGDKGKFRYGSYDTHAMAGKILQKISENDYLSEEDFNKSIENNNKTGINHLATSRKYRKRANK